MIIAEAAPVVEGDAARLIVLINELGPGLSEMSPENQTRSPFCADHLRRSRIDSRSCPYCRLRSPIVVQVRL
jgi:hypothetical protein